MKAIGVITWFCVSALISAMIQALTMTKLWSWFVAAEYGPGPSMGAWFGIATILGLIIGMTTASQAKPKDESWDDFIRKSIGLVLGKWVGCGLILAISWFTGSILGWVH